MAFHTMRDLVEMQVSFFRQFGSAVVKEEYLTLRLGFIVVRRSFLFVDVCVSVSVGFKMQFVCCYRT